MLSSSDKPRSQLSLLESASPAEIQVCVRRNKREVQQRKHGIDGASALFHVTGQIDFIRPLIEQSDYYVLIIGGRYGTIDDDGLSFTHKEFKYAVEMGIPILVMLHGRPETIAVGKSESTEVGKTKLRGFIAEAKQARVAARNRVRDHYSVPGVDFTFDGKLVGLVVAAKIFGITLTPARRNLERGSAVLRKR